MEKTNLFDFFLSAAYLDGAKRRKDSARMKNKERSIFYFSLIKTTALFLMGTSG